MLFRLTLKNIADKKARFVLTTLSVVLGVMFTSGVFIFADSMRSVFGNLSQDVAGRIDLTVRSEQDFGERVNAAPVNPALASVIGGVVGVQATAPIISENDVVVQKDGSALRGTFNTGGNWVGDAGDTNAEDEEDRNNAALSNSYLVDGRAPEDGTEFAMNTSAVNDEDLMIGQSYTIQLPGGTRDFTLVGTFNFASPTEDRNVGSYIVSFDTATATEVLQNGQGWDRIDVLLADNVGNTDAAIVAIQTAVNEACASGEVSCNSNLEVISNEAIQQETQDAFNPTINAFQTVLLAFAGIILAVSIFVIFNTFTIVLGQRVKEFGLMRALGTTGRQITGTVMGEATVVGLVSSGVGMGAGVGLAYLMRWMINLFNLNIPLDTIIIRPRTIIIAFLVGTGVTLVSALVPALRTRRISPMSALRDDIGIATKQIHQRVKLGAIVSGIGLISAIVALFVVTNWILMLIFALAATILFSVGGKRLNPVAGRLATLALGAMFLIAARFGDYDTLEQWIALAIGCALLIVGLNLTSPLFTPALTRIIGWPLRVFAKMTGRLSTENAARSPQRTTTTAAALMIGLTLVATVSIASSSLSATWSDSLDDAVQADWMMCAGDCTNDDLATTFSPSFANDLDALPEVESVVSYRSSTEGLSTIDDDGDIPASAQVPTSVPSEIPTSALTEANRERLADDDIDTSTHAVFAADFDNLTRHLDLDIQEGSLDEAGDMDVAVHQDIVDDEDYELNDVVPVTFSTGQQANFRIVAIYSENIVSGTSWIISLPAWERYFTRNLDVYVSAITAQGVSQDEARVAIERVAANYPQVDVQTKQEFNDNRVGAIGQITTIVNVFLWLALIIAFIGIANTLALSVSERTRELGLLRAVGLLRGQTRRMVLGEGIIISVFGGVLGILLGVVFGITIVSILPNDFISVLEIPWRTLVIYLIIAAVAGMLSSFFPARRASRLKVLDAIASK